jgi:hypothetical protein
LSGTAVSFIILVVRGADVRKHSVGVRGPVGVSPYLVAKRLGRRRENP